MSLTTEKAQHPGEELSHADSRGLLQKDWTEREEYLVKRKLDLIVMPLLMLGFYALQLDRGNIANALTDNFREDVGITQNQFNVGQQLLSVGIVVLEIPSNLILYRLGPQKWLSAQIIIWGAVSIAQAFQNSYGSFLATRLLLGLAESGYIPGALYMLSTLYTKTETAKRTMVFFIGNLTAGASTNLLAYGILRLRGVAGLAGWQWLFILMGIFTVLVGFALALFLPNGYDKPTPLLLPKLEYFNQRELHIMRHRVIQDDPNKAFRRKSITLHDIKSTLANWRVIWPHVLITLCNNVPLGTIGTYAPLVIKTYGFASLRSNALASVGYWILIPVSITFSFVSDRYKQRAITTLIAISLTLVFAIVNQQLTSSNDKDSKYAAIVLITSIGFTAHPLNVAWLMLNCTSVAERAIAMAMIIMSANLAGVIGSQVFRSDDAPRYERGWKVIVGILSLGVAATAGQTVHYWWAKKHPRISRTPSTESSAPADDEKA